MQETRDPIQELLIAARRTQILDAAATVIAEKGFHRATIKDIARVAGIADGTIYTYFSSKTDVLLGLLNRLNESTERQEQFALGSEQDFRAFFTAYLRQRMSLLWSSAEVFRVILSEMLVNVELRELYYQQVIMPTFKVAEQYYQAQSEAGHLRKIDVPLAVRAIASTLLGLLTTQLLGDQEIARRWEELPEVLVTLMFDGLKLGEDTTHDSMSHPEIFAERGLLGDGIARPYRYESASHAYRYIAGWFMLISPVPTKKCSVDCLVHAYRSS